MKTTTKTAVASTAATGLCKPAACQDVAACTDAEIERAGECSKHDVEADCTGDTVNACAFTKVDADYCATGDTCAEGCSFTVRASQPRSSIALVSCTMVLWWF